MNPITQRTRVPLHLYMPKGISLKQLPWKPEVLQDEGIDALWVDGEDLEQWGEDPLTHDRGGRKGLHGLSVIHRLQWRPRTGPHRRLETAGFAIDTHHTDILMDPGEGAGVKKLPLYLHSLHSTSGQVKDELEIMAASAEALRTRGFTDIHCVLQVSRAAALYRAYTFLKRSLQVKTVVVLAEGDGVYDAVIGGALRIGSLCYEGLADGVLIMTRDRAHVDRRSVRQLLDVAKGTLSSIGRFPVGFTIISCPTCGRCEIDIPGMTERVQRLMHSIDAEYCERGRPLAETGGLRVAVMGCNVNGPGEARGADIGIAGGKKGSGTIFMNGEVHATLPEEELFDQFTQLVRDLADERTASF